MARVAASGRVLASGRVAASNRYRLLNMGKSISFNGTSDSFTLPFTPSTTAFSLSFFLNPTAITADTRIVDWQNGGPSGGFTVQIGTSGRAVFDVRNVGTLQASIPTIDPLAIGSWTHIGVTYSNNNAMLYVGGDLVATDTSVTMTAPTQTLTVGKRSTGATNFYSGLIDSLVFVNGRQISATEMNDICLKLAIPTDATCHLNFNDNVTDQTGNGNNATLSGTSYSTNVPRGIRVAP